MRPERAELAARAAQATQRAHRGLPGPWCERAADLRELAGDRKAAARLLLESARRSLARTALASAESALDRARSLAGDDRDLTVEVDEVLVEVLSLAGKPDRAVEVGERLVASLAHSDAPPGRAGKARLSVWEVACECLDVLGRRASVRDYQRGVEVFRRELEIAQRADLRLWALMLVMFAVGVSSLFWMVVLAAVMTVERVAGWGWRLAPPVGLALISIAVLAPLHADGLL
jgi:hypothetical protein